MTLILKILLTANDKIDNFLNHKFIKWPAFIGVCLIIVFWYVNLITQ